MKNRDRFTTATWITIFLFAILILIPIIFDDVAYTSLIPAAAAIATIYFGLIKYWVDSDLIFKSLFIEFNKRFDDLNEDLNNIVEGKDLKGSDTADQVIQKYLNLCAEEYYWKMQGRIRKPVWTSWFEGISYYLKSAVINQYFKEQLQYDTSYYGFLTFIRQQFNP